MSAHELLSRLDALGIALVAEAGRLRVSAARGQLDDALKQSIAAHKSELIDLLSARQAGGAAPQRVPRGGSLPLSLFQERLWVLQRLDPQSTAYLIGAHWQLPAGTGAARAAAAVERLQARHETLRAVYVEENGEPVMRLAPPSPVVQHDLRGLAPEVQRQHFGADLERGVHTPVDLAASPSVRFAVYTLSDELSALMLTAHHIALDAWSIDLLRREIDADLLGAGEPQAPATLQYADYAAWQRSAQDEAALVLDLDWWAERLKGAPPLSAFAADLAPVSAAGSEEGGEARGASVDFEWDADFSTALRELVREEGATVYMALLAACAALLRAHTGQGDVLLGSPMGLRERAEFETMIGPFVNLLVMRLDLSDDPDFAELLHRARDAVLDAHAHRAVPFERLIERLKPVRSFDHSPLFQVAVVQHNATSHGDLVLNSGGALHELTWFLREAGEQLRGSIEYRSDLYSRAAVERLAVQLGQVLRGAVADRHRPVSRLPLLGGAERRRVLHDFNATTVDLDAANFARRFERQATAAPDRVAACCEGQSISYAALNRRANQLARALRQAGIGPGALVGVCLERSLDLLVALLAVHKSGGAYVPLDPGFPAERLAYMLEDSGAGVVLGGGQAAGAFELSTGVTLIDVVADAAGLAQHDALDLDPVGTSADPAYVIYTSGSTGRPKGVAVSQGALANFLASMEREPGLADSDVLAAVTTISFDIAGLELYLPLMVGARIELVARDTAVDGAALAECLERCGATVLQATPATWRLLLEACWRPSRPLRALCGGEGLPRDLADALLARVSELWNLYGPTETTIWSTIERVLPSRAPVSIGRPIANTQVYLLDAHGEPLPVGVTGEVWIGGAGLAIGYHRRPELSAERFVPDRFSGQPGARLYRTGDLARWGDDGRLQHLGRLDHQVKIRGFRIELGEIEAVLGTHPAIRQALVLARDAGPGDPRLVAYLVYAPGEDLTVSDVRRHLRRELPDYMVPSVVVALDAFPLTPNGKLDRAGLPDPFRHAVLAAAEHEPPAPGLEETIAAAWREVLKLERVGAQDNFFELGGHSLLSLRVVTRIERDTGWRVDPRLLFFQNLRQVAAAVGSGLGSSPGAVAAPARSMEATRP